MSFVQAFGVTFQVLIHCTVVAAQIFAIAIFCLTFQNIVRYFHEMLLEISFQGETFRLKVRAKKERNLSNIICITFAQYCIRITLSLLP